MTENMISELIRTMDGMYHLMSLQQTFLDRAAERLQDGNREIEEHQKMLEERDREIEEHQKMLEERDIEIEEYQKMLEERDIEIEEYQELLEKKDQKIQELWEEAGSYQRLSTRLNEENEFLKRQNQELLNLKSS